MSSAHRVKSHVAEEILRARSLTDSLFRQVKPKAWLDRPIPERHRILFYAGHLEAFDWNQIGGATLGLGPVDESLDHLFAFGIDPPPGELPNDRVEDWPSVEQTISYGSAVRRRVSKVIDEASEHSLNIALEHRLMHAETLCYLLHNIPYDRRILHAYSTDSGSMYQEPEMVDVPGGTVTMGRPRDDSFGWDNEYGVHTAEVSDFRISRYKITNDQYLKFVSDGGTPPHYWVMHGSKWFYRGMYSEIPLPGDWPVYVSHDQALAYAIWKGRSLPSESQFHRAAFGTRSGDERPFPWGNEKPGRPRGNFDFMRVDPVSVQATPDGDSAFGVSQMVGNGWEWTRTVFQPFPGFEPFASYPGYSANFFDGVHYVLKGASPATDATLTRSTFRNWFRTHYPYAYTTFRIVED